MDPKSLSINQLSKAYLDGSLRPTTVTRMYLDSIKPDFSYRLVTERRALEQASRAEENFRAGITTGPLQGIPIALKDLMDTKGDVTSAGSRVLANRPPAAQDCPAAARLEVAGAVFLGKTNMTELAFSGVGINPHFGTPGNALNAALIPGGSSSGSGVAVAGKAACAAIGSDTGGSVRIPAAFNGIVGLKVTDKLLPTVCVVPLSTTLDTLGPMTRTVADAWTVLLALSARVPEELEQVDRPMTLLVPTTILLEDLDPVVERAFAGLCESLTNAGHTLEYRAVPLLKEVGKLYNQYGNFASHEALAVHGYVIASSGELMDPRVTKRILEAKDRQATEYIRLTLGRAPLIREFWQNCKNYDAVLSPTVPILPPPIIELQDEERYFEVNQLCLRNTSIFNFYSGPAVSVPIESGLPVGAMIATAPNQERLAIQIGMEVERLHTSGKSVD